MKSIIGSLSSRRHQGWQRAAFIVVALSALVALGLPACGNSTPAPTNGAKTCSLNSDCAAPLICAIGVCRQQCAQDSDCPGSGETCVFGVDKNNNKGFYCQAAAVANAACSTPKDCTAPMACASDYRCRNLCMTDADCNVLGAVNKVCAQDANGVDYCASLSDVTVNAMGDQVISAPPNPLAATDAAVMEPVDASMVMIAAPEGGLPDATVGASSGSSGGSGSMSASGAGSGAAGLATGGKLGRGQRCSEWGEHWCSRRQLHPALRSGSGVRRHRVHAVRLGGRPMLHRRRVRAGSRVQHREHLRVRQCQ